MGADKAWGAQQDSGTRYQTFFFYHGFADLLRQILCPNLQFRTPLSILT